MCVCVCIFEVKKKIIKPLYFQENLIGFRYLKIRNSQAFIFVYVRICLYNEYKHLDIVTYALVSYPQTDR